MALTGLERANIVTNMAARLPDAPVVGGRKGVVPRVAEAIPGKGTVEYISITKKIGVNQDLQVKVAIHVDPNDRIRESFVEPGPDQARMGMRPGWRKFQEDDIIPGGVEIT